MEKRFFEKAAAAGMSNEEAKYAFNNNMMASGLLSDDPRAFGREFGRRWMVADYEAVRLLPLPPSPEGEEKKKKKKIPN
jgi:phytanoyl-CoA hydroxylase